ncbi:hypothetical protein V6N13_002044 [Hibiscus sabdariffa]
MRVADPPVDVKEAFYRFSPSGTMAVDDLLRELHLHDFFTYLLADLNLAHPPSSKVHHDMNAPLSHYFLFTAHNSYLSSVEPIKDALLRGVRVIELDLWPDSKGNHVKDNAFRASEYPVVITFEDHLNPNLQEKVAKMVRETFGDMLFTNETENLEQFLSPESLKKKILISTKPPKVYQNTQGEEILENGSGTVKNEGQSSQGGPNDEVFDASAPLAVKTVMRVDRYCPTYDCTILEDKNKVVKETATIDDDWLPVWNEEFEFQLRVPNVMQGVVISEVKHVCLYRD